MYFATKIVLCFVIAVIAIHGVVALTELCRFVRKFFMTKQRNLVERYGRGSWAVITGGSSGQGKEFALQLARMGFNLVLIGSRRSYAVANTIRAQTGQSVHVVEKDFSKAFEPKFFDEIESVVQSVDCSILINNVGHRTGWIPYHEQPPDLIQDTIACGTIVQARMTHILLPRFIARKHRHASSIVFITAQCMHPSFGFAIALPNEISIPYLAVYEASNSFGYYHACSIVKEYGHHPWLDVLNITPGAVLTENTSQVLKTTPFAVDASVFVGNILRFMGGNVNGTTCGHWGHSLSNGLISIAPFMKDTLLEKVGRRIAMQCMQKYNKTKAL